MILKLNNETISDLLFCEATPILEIKIDYPQIEGHVTKLAERNFNSYYENSAKALNLRARNEIYRQALRDYKYSKKNAYPFNLYSFLQTWEQVYLDANFVSLYTDLYVYTGGAHGNTDRKGYTWSLKKCRKIALSEFFGKNVNYKNIILKQVREQINADTEGIYFEDANKLAEKYFNPANYYLNSVSCDGHAELTVFYPLYTIAPYYAGIRTFNIIV